MTDIPQVDWYRRSGGAPSADQSLAPSDVHHEMPSRRPVWIVFRFFAVMIGITVWLLATNTADPDEQPGAAVVAVGPG
jgi:hypothetical protein